MTIDKFRVWFPLVCACSWLPACAASTSDEGPSSDDAAPDEQTLALYGGPSMLQAGLDTLRAEGNTGVLAEVADGKRRFLARSGVSRLGSEQPVAFNSYFRIGSNTKTFVSVVLLQLVGEGKLALEDSVERWLPGVIAGNGNEGNQITVRQLLQHTSGLYDYVADLPVILTVDGYYRDRFHHAEPEELVGLAMNHAPEFPPGSSWDYSNTNYVLVGMIIERITGHRWSAEVRSRIIGPLGLSHTFDPGDLPSLPSPHAEGYNQFSEEGPLVDTTLANQSWPDAAGALVSTITDLTKFWRALQQGSLLRPAQMAEMHETVPAVTFQEFWPGARYGLGIMRLQSSCGDGYWSHGGDTLGYSTRNGVSDDGSRSVVISLSTELADGQESLDTATQLIDELLCAPRPRP